MARFLKDRSASLGQVPGTPVHIGEQKMEEAVISLMDISADGLVEKELASIEEATHCKDSDPVSWINIWGVHDVSMIQRLGEIFQIPALYLEDILNTDHRPKFEESDSLGVFILKMAKYDEVHRRISATQCTVILGERFVITLQEQKGNDFNVVRERIRNTKKRTKFVDPDYLAYVLLDTIVDNYIQVVESIGRQIEALEDRLFKKSDPQLIEDIHVLKNELSYLRKSVRPVREFMLKVVKSDNDIFQEKYLPFIRDLNDLVYQATDAIELYNGMISDHLNIYSIIMNERTNKVMQMLTIFASIFIPLTFFAGIYGMNFQHFPELSFKYSYLFFWIVSILVAVALLIFFKRKKWL